jgi:hypothetical protein
MESTEPTSTCGNAYGSGHYGDFLEAKAKLREEDGRRNQTKCIPVTQFLYVFVIFMWITASDVQSDILQFLTERER